MNPFHKFSSLLLLAITSLNAYSNPIIRSMDINVDTAIEMIGNADEQTFKGRIVRAINYGRCASSILSKDNISLNKDDEAIRLKITEENLSTALDFFNKRAYAELYKGSLLSDEPIELHMAKDIASTWINEAAESYTAFRTTNQLQKDRVDCIYYGLIVISVESAYDDILEL
jgi:hypothetical protein